MHFPVQGTGEGGAKRRPEDALNKRQAKPKGELVEKKLQLFFLKFTNHQQTPLLKKRLGQTKLKRVICSIKSNLEQFWNSPLFVHRFTCSGEPEQGPKAEKQQPRTRAKTKLQLHYSCLKTILPGLELGCILGKG